MTKFFMEMIKDIHYAFCAFVRDKDSHHKSCIEPMECQKTNATRPTNDKIHIDWTDTWMLCDEYLVVLVGATHIATSFNLVLILLGECFTRAYHAGSFEIAALCGKNAVVYHRLKAYPKGLLMYWLFVRMPKREYPFLSMPMRESKWLRSALQTMPHRL